MGEDNRFGHPHPETLATLSEMLSDDRILATYENGSVEFVSDGTRLTMSAER